MISAALYGKHSYGNFPIGAESLPSRQKTSHIAETVFKLHGEVVQSGLHMI